MILKDDHRSTVYDIGDGLIRKVFKPGRELNIDLFNDNWKMHMNQFTEKYGQFPKIITHSSNEIIMERIDGESFEKLRNKGYRADINEQVHIFKKMQFLYLNFVTNLSKYNLKNNISFFHSDLNFSNLILRENKLVVIDPDSVFINRNICENSFISFFLTRLDNYANHANCKHKNIEYDNLIAKSNTEKKEVNTKHRNKIKELDKTIAKLKEKYEN